MVYDRMLFVCRDRYGNLISRDFSLIGAARTSWYVPKESDLQHVLRDILPACWVDGEHNFWVPIETHPELAVQLQALRQSELSLGWALFLVAALWIPAICIVNNCGTFFRAVLAAWPEAEDRQLILPIHALGSPPAKLHIQTQSRPHLAQSTPVPIPSRSAPPQ